MAKSIVVSDLKQKHSELSGETQVAEKHLEQLTRSLEHLDNTLRLFDPELKPETIKPRTKRKQSGRFQSGELTRAVLTTLRKAEAPLSVKEIAERLGEATGLDMSTMASARVVADNVRACLARPHDGVRCEKEGKGPMRWRAA
jgi:hypothetical protein